MSRGSSRKTPSSSAPTATVARPAGPMAPRTGPGRTSEAARGRGAEAARAGGSIDTSLETSRSAIEERLGPDLENEFPDDSGPTASRNSTDQPMTPSDWSGVGSGGREDSDYNLESFVSAAPTLADHLAEQLALAIIDPVRRMIGQFLIDMVDEAGYLAGAP